MYRPILFVNLFALLMSVCCADCSRGYSQDKAEVSSSDFGAIDSRMSDRQAKRESELAVRASQNLKETLRIARESLSDVKDVQVRRKLDELLLRAELDALVIRNLLETAPTQRNEIELRSISKNDLAKLIKSLQDHAFDSGKLETLTDYVIASKRQSLLLTSAQARQLLEIFSFDQSRVDAAVQLHQVISDPQNFFQALEVFDFDSNRQKVRELVKEIDRN